MTKRSLKVCAAAGLAASLTANAAPSITSLGVLSGFDTSYPAAISPDGLTVVGRSERLTSGSLAARRAFRWTADTGMESLGTFADSQFSIDAVGVSANGTIVGRALIDGGLGSRAFRWTPGDGLNELSESPGMNPTAISADGSTIVGTTFALGGGFNVVRVRDGGVTVIPGIDGADNTVISGSQNAWGVSADGSVIVGRTHRYSFNQPVAFRWTEATGAVQIGEPATRGAAVSADGSVVAVDFAQASSSEAIRWTDGGTTSIPGAFPWSQINVMAMSGDGNAIVGNLLGGGPGPRAFLWTPSLGTVNLNDYLPTIGVLLDGWVLENATAISADGTRIAGYGRHTLTGGQVRNEGFLITIPAPGTAVLLGCGLFTQRRRR